MSEIARDPADEDRLPWLEAVVDEGGDDGVSVGKLVALIVAALVALGIVIGGVWALRSRQAPQTATTDPKLIAAPAGDYKVKPENPGGMKVEGKGDSSFATSEGAEANGKIDTNALPETPVKGVKGAATTDAAGKASANPTVGVPKGVAPLVAKPPVVIKTPSLAGSGVLQLGAYGSQAKADAGWSTLSKKFGFLTGLNKSIAPAEVGGATVYRLRVDAGAQSAGICAKLKAAGENCIQAN
ncbi:MAG: SPOR domain-containing protein [Sphingomonadales bacterium]